MRHLLSFRHLLLALPLLAALLCTSCQRHSAVWPQLLEAETLLDTDLPAAASLLDSLDATPLRGEDAALYAILKTQADYKRYVPLSSDSLPRLATDYYGTPYRKNYHAAMAWYSLGCCYMDMNRTEDAFGAYLHAKRFFPSPANRYYALCLQNIGRCYLDRGLYDDALRHFDACRSAAVALQDSAQIAVCDYYKGNCHLYLQDYTLADSLYTQAVNNPLCKRTVRQAVFLQQAQMCYYGEGDAASALTLTRRYIQEMGNGASNTAAWLMMGTIYASQNKLDSAAACFASISPDSSEPYNQHEWLYQQLITQLRQAGQDTIIPLVDRFVFANDSLHQLRNQAEIISLREDYDHESRESRLRHRYGSIVAALLLFSLLFGLGFVLQDNRRRKEYIRVIDGLKRSRMVEERQRLQLERMTDEVNRYKNQYEEVWQRVQALETSTEDAVSVALSADTATLRALALADYRERMDICARQFKEGDSWKLVLLVVHGGNHYLTRVERQTIVHDLNVCFTDFYEILLAEGQKMGQTDKNVAVGYYLGLRVDVIEEVLGIADNAIRARKSRMKSKLPVDLFELIFETP